jgi:DNA-binding MarR family transcriptional regulator
VSARPAAADLATAVEQLLAALARRRGILGDAEPSPLSTFQAVALGVLVDIGPLRLSAFADSLETTDATASRTTDALEDLGLAERVPDASDGRGVLVGATRDGHRAIRRRRQRLARILDHLVEGMEPAEGRRLTELLDELRELLLRSA